MTFLEVLGYVILAVVSVETLRCLWYGIYLTFLAPALGRGVNWNILGKWAVVTGSTDGIGKAYAIALAKKGFDIVLISRTQNKLDAVAKEIENLANVETKTIAVDFSSGSEIYDTIRKGLQGLQVGVLVNNVGMAIDIPRFYVKIPDGDKYVEDILNTNLLSCSMMMRMVLPSMSARKTGVIINVSSLSALFPHPLISIYGATKAYMDYLSQALQSEHRHHDIIIQSVLPGFVKTNLAKFRETSYFVPSPKTYVDWALKTVGLEEWTAGYPLHKLYAYFMKKIVWLAPGLLAFLWLKITFIFKKEFDGRSNEWEDPIHILLALFGKREKKC